MTSRAKLQIKHKTKPEENLLINKKSKIKYNKKAESEFFVDNSALAGFTGERILYMAVRELIENALDSCETHHILPEITITLKQIDDNNDLWYISCQDNGIGIPVEKIPVAVCSFLTSGKYIEKQQRGLFGVGLKMIAAFSTKDTDNPIKTWSKSLDDKGTEFYHELRTDIATNNPIILNKLTIKKTESIIKGKHGFRIDAVLRARLSPITKNRIYDYITQTSIVNPYAVIIFKNDDGKLMFDKRTKIMPEPAKEVLPHPADMDLQTLKKAIINFTNLKTTIQGVLSSSFQKLSNEKAKEIIRIAEIDNKLSNQYSEHELIKIVNVCKQMKFQSPNTDHLSPIGDKILTTGMMSEYTIVNNKDTNKNNMDIKKSKNQQSLNVKILKPSLVAYSSRSTVINNRPTIIECGIAYGGDINSFKLYRFANKIPLLYDEGSDVAKEVVTEVGINKMGITKKQAKEQFAKKQFKSDRAVELLPVHIFFHICSTKIPYKTAGKESIASEGDMKKYMKYCLSELYRKVSAQIRKEMKIKDAENRLRLYKFYIPLIVEAIVDSIKIDKNKLSDNFTQIAEKHVKGQYIIKIENKIEQKEDKIEITKNKEDYLKHDRNKAKEMTNRNKNKNFEKQEKKYKNKNKKQITLDSFKLQKEKNGG